MRKNPIDENASRFYGFPGIERLKRRKDIQEVFQKRKAVSCAGAKLFYLHNGLLYNRIAFTFPRKFGTAVQRNYSRRLSREAYRLLRNDLQKGNDMVLLVFPGMDNLQIRIKQLKELFSRSGILS